MKYLFSPSVNAFYPEELKSYYEAAGSLPADLIEVDSEVFDEFTSTPEGKIRVVGNDGMPTWGDVPPPTHEVLVVDAEKKKSLLLAEAQSAIAPLQDAFELDMATEEEKALLLAWKKYRVLLNRIDTSLAPDIEWPISPASQAS